MDFLDEALYCWKIGDNNEILYENCLVGCNIYQKKKNYYKYLKIVENYHEGGCKVIVTSKSKDKNKILK